MANRKYGKCHKCLGWVPADDPTCPHCGAEQSLLASLMAGARRAGKGAQQSVSGSDSPFENVSTLLLGALFVMFAIPIVALARHPDFHIAAYLLGADTVPPTLLGALTKGPFHHTGYGPDGGPDIGCDTFVDHQYWRLIAGVFLHHGIIHLGFNCSALATLGPKIQRFYGPGFLMFLFVATGALGFVVTYVAYADRVLSAGASGAIFGLIGTGMASAFRAGDRHELRTYASWLIGSVLISLFAPINNWAHFGGLVGGLLFGYLVPEHRVPVYPALQRLGTVLGVLATIAVFVSLYFAAEFAQLALAAAQP